MNWRKTINQESAVALLNSVILLFCLLGVIFVSFYFFYIGLLYSSILFINHLYNQYSGESLQLKNEKRRQRHFIGDTGKFEFEFTNNGLPILNGELVVVLNKRFSFEKGIEDEHTFTLKVPFTITRKETVKIVLPFMAAARGVGRISKVSVVYTNLFGFSVITLDYLHFYGEEVLIYPNIKEVEPFRWNSIIKEGNQSSRNSLFEDRSLIVGTRNYSPGDSFQTVHWKASAKAGQLQTKVFEKTTDISILIVMNVADRFLWNYYLEEMISHVAYIVQKANKENIPVSFAANIRAQGDRPFLYIPVGEGNTQFHKIMEMLAVIDIHQMILPYERLLQYILKQGIQTPYIIHTGIRNDNHNILLNRMEEHGADLYELQATDDSKAQINKLNLRGQQFSNQRGS